MLDFLAVAPCYRKFAESVALDHYCANVKPWENDPNASFADGRGDYSLFAELPLPIIKKMFSMGASDEELAVVPFEKNLAATLMKASFGLAYRNLRSDYVPTCGCIVEYGVLDTRCFHSMHFFEKKKCCDICDVAFRKYCPKIKSTHMVERKEVEETVRNSKDLGFRNFYKKSTKKYVCNFCYEVYDLFEGKSIDDFLAVNCGNVMCKVRNLHNCPGPNVFCEVQLRKFLNSASVMHSIELLKIIQEKGRYYLTEILTRMNRLYEFWCIQSDVRKIRTKVRNELM